MAFLDNTGLGTVWGRIKTVFGAGFADLVKDSTSVTIKLQNGYGNDLDTVAIPLADSTNSKAGLMSPTEKSKLAGIASGAEVNVQADWNQTTTTADDYIKNKPSTMPPSHHTHGVINNDGTIPPNTGVTVMNGDRFVISRVGSNGVIRATTLSFDGTTTNKYLSPKGEWEELPSGVSPSSTTPAMDGTAAVGTEDTYARGDHVHPSDTSRVPTTRTVNGHALSADVNINSSDIYVAPNITLGSWISTVQPNINYVDTGKKVTTYVSEQISSAMTGSAKYKGTVGTGGTVTTLPTSGYKQGDYYVVCSAGTYAGETCEVGDMIFANKDYASGAVAADDWDIVQANITAMTTAEINAICV